MLRFIKWEKAKDEVFRAAYNATVVNENIGLNIRENIEQTHYLIGSSRISDSEKTTLENNGNFTVEILDAIPSDWKDLESEII